jgi:glycosyltransferase involved in cell wall biosynthesis
MKILILIDWFAPAFKGGGPIQSVMNMVENGETGFEYKVVCSNKDLDGTILNVEPDTWVAYNSSTTVWYSSDSKQVLQLINRETASWNADVLFINGIYSFYYNFLPILLAKTPRKIISVRGTLHDGALSQKSFKKKIFLQVWKFLKLHRKNEFHASTEEEKGFVEKVFGKGLTISVAANFPKIFYKTTYPEKVPGCLHLISVALISPMKNHLPVLEALQDCQQNIHYDIYGPVKDPVYWQKCKEQMERLPPNITAQYQGELLPHQVESALGAAHVFILPSKSENFGHAIYEALIGGKPVITSHRTPWNGLQEAKAGRNVSPESGSEIKAAIEFFTAMDSTEFSEWAQSATEYAKSRIDIETIKTQYRQMFVTHDIIKRQASATAKYLVR